MEGFLFTVKLVGLTIASCLGVFGIMHDYRDKVTGRLTRFGRMAIAGLILSALGAIVAQTVEESLKDKSAKEAALQAAASAARSERVVNDLSRVLQPLRFKSLFISELKIPLDDERFRRLRTNIDSIAADYQRHYKMSKLPSSSKGVSGISVDCTKVSGECSPLSVEIDGTNPAFPKSGLEAAIFRMSSIFVALYRTPISPERFEHYVVGSANEADLSLDFGSIVGPDVLKLSKDLTSGTYNLKGAFSTIQMKRDASGRMVAIPDLAGSQIFLRLPSNAVPDDMVSLNFGVRIPKSAINKLSDVVAFQKRFEMGAVAFDLGERRMWVPKTAWRKHVTKTAIYWEYVVPADPFKFGSDGPR
jgi:hypothetical protein